MAFDKKLGKEVMDSTPVAVPIHFQRQAGMNDAIRRIIESREIQKEAFRQGKETFAEANDFDVGDDAPDFTSPHEDIFDPVDEEVLTRLENDAYAKKVNERFEQLEPLVNPKGKSDGKGSSQSKQSGVGHGNKRLGQSHKVQQSKSKQKSAADDKGSVSEADSDAGDVEE